MRSFKVVSICWHGIEPESANSDLRDGCDPTLLQFREQIRYLVEHYTPISIRTFIELSENPLRLAGYKKPPILLTFDDGFKSVIDQALPVLQEFAIPAAFFVIGQILEDPEFVPWYLEGTHMLRKTSKTSVVYRNTTVGPISRAGRKTLMHLFYGAIHACHTQAQCEKSLDDFAELLGVKRPRASDLDPDLRLIGAEDLANLDASSLLTVGSHAMTHRFLANLTFKDQLFELERSQLLLSKVSPSYFPALAYPGGSFNADTVAIAKTLYKCGLALISGSSYRDMHAYPRVIGGNTASDLAYAISPLRLTYLLPIKRLLEAGRIWNAG